MPPWGRPSGGRIGKKGQKEWARQRSWDERRFEEIEESDEDQDLGVELTLGVSQKRFVADELRFTGIDLKSARPRRRKGNTYDEDSASFDEDEEEEGLEEGDECDGDTQSMQVMLREKEDFLVERALERIRRARMMGKTNVKLSQAEIDALERAERAQKQPDSPRNPKARRALPRPPKKEERRRSKTDKSLSSAPPPKAIESRRKARTSPREEASPPYSPSPGPEYGQATGAMVYAPHGYYPGPIQRPTRPRSKSGNRTTSSQSLRQQQPSPLQQVPPPTQQQYTPPLPQFQHPYYATRYFSDPDPSYAGRSPSNSSLRSDPSDPNWEPRARSTSNLVPYPVDQPPYHMYPPPPPPLQFDPRDPRFSMPLGPRITSGPPDMYPASQLPAYRHPQNEMYLHSPPTGMRPTGGGEGNDDDEEEGMEIDVVERPGASYGVQTRSNTAAATAAASGNRGTAAGSTAKGKKRGK